MLLRTMIALICLFGVVLPSQAETTTKNGIAIVDAWAPATGEGAIVASVYLELRAGAAGDSLQEAFSDMSEAVEVHGYVREAGILKRVRLEFLAINPGQTLGLVPGGYHLALVGLREPLIAGTTFPMTLKFANIGEVEIPVQVVGAERERATESAAPLPLVEPGPGGGVIYHGGPRFWPIPIWPPHGSH